MPESLANFKTRVTNLSRIPTVVISDAQLGQAIEAAISRYSKDLPLEETVGVTLNSTDIYDLSDIVAAWSDEYSVTQIDYVFDSGDRLPVDDNDFDVYKLASTHTLRIRRRYNGPVYLTYTYPHTLSAEVSTIRDRDRDPLAALAASYCLQMYSVETSDASSSSIVGDGVSYSSIPDKLDARSQALLKVWTDHVEANSDYAAFGEWDLKSALGTMMFHGGTRF